MTAMTESCHLALHGWPMVSARGGRVTPCSGYIESDYEPGTFYPCHDCNPNWQRVAAPNVALSARPIPSRAEVG